MIKMVLFDLDGTLLPMNQDLFIKEYFAGISKRLVSYGYDPKKLVYAIGEGTKAMFLNNGEDTNEMTYWNKFAEFYGENRSVIEPQFEEFYIKDFSKLKDTCGCNPKAREVLDLIKSKKKDVALLTNPIFPRIATKQRIMWAGLGESDFKLYTTYENSSYCKPNLKYYIEAINKLGVKPEECLMVGNDVVEDMVAKKLGMKVFLLTDCLINKYQSDISIYPNGDFNDLINYLNNNL